MRIIVDVDDVLADTFGALEDRFGKAADATVEDLQLMFPGAEVRPILDSEEFHAAIPPLHGAAEGVRWLLEVGHSARYLSSCPPAMENPTREWLRRWHFPEIPLQCLGKEKKKDALRSEPYELLIDDMLTYLTIARDRGKQAIAFANPWNSTWDDLKVVAWSQIKDVIMNEDSKPKDVDAYNPNSGRPAEVASMPGNAKPESPSQLIDARIEELPDWRGETLSRIRRLIKDADPDVVEEVKWRKPSNSMLGVPVWSHDGMICTGETYKDKVKLTFAKGASLEDPAALFNASLEGNVRRAIDIHEGEEIDESAFKSLVRAAAALNALSRR